MLLNLILLADSGVALGAALVLGLIGLGGAIGMGLAIYKAVEAIGRQPEASARVRGTLLMGLAFIETLVIYGFLIAILILVL